MDSLDWINERFSGPGEYGGGSGDSAETAVVVNETNSKDGLDADLLQWVSSCDTSRGGELLGVAARCCGRYGDCGVREPFLR